MIHEVQKKEKEFGYELKGMKVRFSREARKGHRQLAKKLRHFFRDSHLLSILVGPIIWSCLIPLLLLDLVTSLFQAVCFPVYGIPKVRRKNYIIMDRHLLGYLNMFEKLNCLYCGYANGLLAYVGEMAGRVEQYWCPIKHAIRACSMHSRYSYFFEYGDAESYREKIEELRRNFIDLEPSACPPGNHACNDSKSG